MMAPVKEEGSDLNLIVKAVPEKKLDGQEAKETTD